MLTCYEVYGLELPPEMQPLQWAVDDLLRFAGWEWAVWFVQLEHFNSLRVTTPPSPPFLFYFLLFTVTAHFALGTSFVCGGS